jgi:hypothetical protein
MTTPITTASQLAEFLAKRYVKSALDLDQKGETDNLPAMRELLAKSGISEATLSNWLLESPVLMAVVFFARAVEGELMAVEAELHRLACPDVTGGAHVH